MAMASGAMMAPLAWWILLGALAGGAAWLLLPRRYGGPPISVFSSNRTRGDETHAGAGLWIPRAAALPGGGGEGMPGPHEGNNR